MSLEKVILLQSFQRNYEELRDFAKFSKQKSQFFSKVTITDMTGTSLWKDGMSAK
jgi:hypothetical protein